MDPDLNKTVYKSGEWVDAGLAVLSNSGKIELNAVCKQLGKAKSSFYHIYPNTKNSRGFDRFRTDVYAVLIRVMEDCFSQMLGLVKEYPFPEALYQIPPLVKRYYPYQRCCAWLFLEPDLDAEAKRVGNLLYQRRVEVVYQISEHFYPEEDSTTRREFIETIAQSMLSRILKLGPAELMEENFRLVNMRLNVNLSQKPLMESPPIEKEDYETIVRVLS